MLRTGWLFSLSKGNTEECSRDVHIWIYISYKWGPNVCYSIANCTSVSVIKREAKKTIDLLLKKKLIFKILWNCGICYSSCLVLGGSFSYQKRIS